MNLTDLYREIEALGGATIMDDYEEGRRDGLGEALAVLRKYGFGVDLSPVTKEERGMSNTEEPAFPRDHRYQGHNGMSLRDYLASQVIGPLVITTDAATRSTKMPYPEAVTYVAKLAYDVADAMLAARKAAA